MEREHRRVWREGERCKRGEGYISVLGRSVESVYWRSWVGLNFCNITWFTSDPSNPSDPSTSFYTKKSILRSLISLRLLNRII